MENVIKQKISSSAFAFRGYNVTNLGRTPELLEHKVYGPIVQACLKDTSRLCAESLKRPIDLETRVREKQPTTLESFPLDAALIIAIEMAHLRILEEIFEVPTRQARLSVGYSVGELPALALGGVFELDQLAQILFAMADDCAELAKNVTMGVVFSRGPGLSFEDVTRLCMKISSEGAGLISPSTHLAPNAILVLGENSTVQRFQEAIPDFFPERVNVRKNQHKWPPLHTPLVWQKNLTTRAATALATLRGGFQPPSPPIVSCVTGKASYNDYNARDHLVRWCDHPQLLWDALYEMIASGVDIVLHVGPDPNLIPATFQRLNTDISAQLGNTFLRRLGRRVISQLALRPWLTPLLSQKAALLRVPFIEHIVLEDWFLDYKFPETA